ncbi:hypothetical protein MFLAVUS_002143 [Mucor flavus]|uniref:MIT domain-containing protein n=1 Tax=Mucor flavus TaxID=439312 RepID=A0ABP9YPG5_9FUNG
MSQHSELLDLALEKSNLAVNRDSGVGDKVSVHMYKEAVDALQRVLDTDLTGNKSKLKSIQESYLKRIEFLSSSLTKLNVVTPIQRQKALLELKPSTSTPITIRKKSNLKNNNNNRYSTDFSNHEKLSKQDYFDPDSPDTMFFEKQFKIDFKPKSVTEEIFHPHMEPSVSTSSFQTILGRKKNSKLTEENNLKSTLVSYLQYNKKTVDLGRSKSKKKWSMNTTTNNQQNNKTPYMSSQSSLYSVNEDTTTSITLMDTFLESMTQGGFITSNLYAPKDLWFQSNIWLPATDAKIVACELLFVILEKMEKRKDFHDFSAIEIDLSVLEQTLNHIKDTLIKKLGCLIPENDSVETNSSRYSFMGGSSGIKTTQTLSAWSSKLSKSVERMKFEASKAIPTSDQNNEAYIKTLIRLFTLAKVLDQWNTIIEGVAHQKPLTYKRAFLTIQRCINLFKVTVCEFVLKDYEALLDKWLKRSSDWMFD